MGIRKTYFVRSTVAATVVPWLNEQRVKLTSGNAVLALPYSDRDGPDVSCPFVPQSSVVTHLA